jgi:hypothetical protein
MTRDRRDRGLTGAGGCDRTTGIDIRADNERVPFTRPSCGEVFLSRRQIAIGPTSLLVTFGAGQSSAHSKVLRRGANRRTGGNLWHLFAIYGQ